MNDKEKDNHDYLIDRNNRLELLKKPFESADMGRLPKPTKKQTEAQNAAFNKKDFSDGIRCEECGGFHLKGIIHLDYVGHAATTKRLLEVDPGWNWEPLAFDEYGLPKLTSEGLLWIRLTILGLSRFGVGDAGGKAGGNAMKECIGDAIRNAAMRFGVALELWHKGEFATIGDDSEVEQIEAKKEAEKPELLADQKETWARAILSYLNSGNLDNVLKHVHISDENQRLIKKQANEQISSE